MPTLKEPQAPAPRKTFEGEQPFRLAGTELVPENVVANQLAPLFKGDCIDIGCGVGRNLQLMPRGSVALDYVQANLDQIPSDYKRMQADVNRPLPFEDNSFDVAFCGHVMEHVHSPFLFVQEIHRILRPNGVLILGVPNPCCAWMDYYSLSKESDWSEHLYGWNWKQLRRFMRNIRFKVERMHANYPSILRPFGGLVSRSRFFLRFGSDVWVVARKSEEQIFTPPPKRLFFYRLLKSLGFRQA